MGDLGEALVLMHGARYRFRSVALEARHWTHTQRARRAFERHAGGLVDELAPLSPGEPRPASLWVNRLWWVKPDRLREEQEDVGGDNDPMVRVVDGARFWSLAGGELASSDHMPGLSSPPTPHVGYLLDPALVLPVVDLSVEGEATQAGRAALVLAARPRDRDDSLSIGHLPSGADEYELLVDRATGVLLRVAAFIDGEEFMVTEITSIAFDEPIDQERFVLVPPEGVRLMEPPPPLPISPTRTVTLAEAAEAAPFTLLVPTYVPAGLELSLVNANIDHPSVTPQVHLVYELRVGGTAFGIMEAAVGSTPVGDIEEEPVDRHGRRVMVSRSVPPRVRVEAHGTDARLSGSVTLDELLEIAASLFPHSPEGTGSG
jgi:outer membrane lipoprotein-sorting protein